MGAATRQSYFIASRSRRVGEISRGELFMSFTSLSTQVAKS
jgi:hypothetical protein